MRLPTAMALLLSLAGCSSAAPDGTPEDQTQNATAASTVNLLFEGTCSFLHDCSSFSQKLPDDQVSMGCTGVQVCDDSEQWLAGPNRSFCGKTVRMCSGGTCTTATVKDVSVSHSWEASPGTLDALGLPHGLTGQCAGFGGGKVSLVVQ